jgi:hypothetical protein
MSDDQYAALYVYETIILRVDPAAAGKMYKLEFVDGEFVTEELGNFEEQLELGPGVYGWYTADPISIAIDGHAILITMRKVGKDPWPPPPPPPVTPNFATNAEATKLWALHWVGRDLEFFMAALD